jgi:pyrroline-5-carboxylate reductase
MGETATKKDEERVAKLFGAIGKVWTAEEKYFDAITGLRYISPNFSILCSSFIPAVN